jgi:glycine oxidase
LLSGLNEVLEEHATLDEHHLRLEQQALDALQPGVLAPFGAVLHEADAAIDNVRLLGSLRQAAGAKERLTYDDDAAVRVVVRPTGVSVTTSSGTTIEAGRLLVAAGAWTPKVAGLPRTLPVRPLKGQMLSLEASVLTHPVMAGHVYLVPRGSETVVGATSEEAGFNTTVEPEVIEQLRRAAGALVPALLDAPVARTWAGIRPATPDMLPIIARDPENESVVYAVGHSRNGILLAPLTAVVAAQLVLGANATGFDIGPFALTRFEAAAR